MAFKQEKADDSITMHKSKFCPNNETGEYFAEECLPSGCYLQHYANWHPTQTQARCKSLLRKQIELNLEKKISC